MKWHFLGTSHGQPTPTRRQTSNLLVCGGRNYLIDAGSTCNFRMRLRGVSPWELSAVFITHMHSDHTGDLMTLMSSSIQYRPLRKDLAFNLYLPGTDERYEYICNAFRRMADACCEYDLTDFTFRHYSAGKEPFFDDGVLKVRAIENHHYPQGSRDRGNRSNCFELQAEDRRVLYSGDLSYQEKFADFPLEAADGCDAVVCEATHFPVDVAIPRLKSIHFSRLIFNHVFISDDRLEEWRDKVQQLLGIPVWVARDGALWDWQSGFFGCPPGEAFPIRYC